MKKRTYRTAKGAVLTDSDIEKLADEAEAGYDVKELRRRGGRPLIGSGPSQVVPVRLDPDLRKALLKQAKAEKTSQSDLIRRALHMYLAAPSKL